MKNTLIISLVSALLVTQSLSAAAPQGNELVEAVVSDNLTEVERLLAAGADPNITDRLGYTPLYEAAYNNNIEIVKALLAAGADPNITRTDRLGYTPLYEAANRNNIKMVEALLAAGADPTITADGITPAEVAKEEGFTKVAEILEQAAESPMIKSAKKR